MKYLLVSILFLTGCTTVHPVDPTPIQKLDIKWEVIDKHAALSFEDYNKLGVWLRDVNRYISDQKMQLKMCKE